MKICLIGSTRFMDKYLEVNRKLSLYGHVVYSVATRSSSAEYRFKENLDNKEGRIEPVPDALTAGQKETLDLVHLRKIQESDCCFLITDETGYIGESTKREIKWAAMNNIEVKIGDHVLNRHLCKDLEAFVEEHRTQAIERAKLGDPPCDSSSPYPDGLPDFIAILAGGGKKPKPTEGAPN